MGVVAESHNEVSNELFYEQKWCFREYLVSDALFDFSVLFFFMYGL